MSRQGRRNDSVGDKSSVSRAKRGRITRSFNQVTEAELEQAMNPQVATRKKFHVFHKNKDERAQAEPGRCQDDPGECEKAVSVTTGLTVLSVFSTSSHQPVSMSDRAEIVRTFPQVVLINSHGSSTTGLQLGIDKSPREVYRQLASLKEELPHLVFSLEDVSSNDPFAYFEGWTVIPRVDKTGLYQLLVQLKPPFNKKGSLEAKRILDGLISSFNVAKLVKGDAEMIVQVNHVLEFIAYSDCLRQEPGISLERRHTWVSRPAGKVERSEVGAGDRIFWIKVDDKDFNTLSVARKQYNLKLRLDMMGKVRQLEHQLFGVTNNYLAVFSGKEEVNVEAAECGLSVLELSSDSLPATYIPTYEVDQNGFYTVSGRFPGDVSTEQRSMFASDMKKIGAVGFTGNDSVFSLHYVTSRSAEAAVSLSRLAQYSNFNLKLLSSQLRKPNIKPSAEKTNAMKVNSESVPAKPADVVNAGVKKAVREPQVIQKESSPALKTSSKVADVDREIPDSQPSDRSAESQSTPATSAACEMTETELLTINWQQGKTLASALKSLAKFLASVNVVEVVQKEDSKTVVFKFTEKKKFIKILKIYSRNETNSFDKLRAASPRLKLSASRANGNMYGLTVTKKKDDKEFIRKLMSNYRGVKIEERSHVRIIWLPTKLDYFKVVTDKSLGVNFVPSIQNYAEIGNQAEEVRGTPKNSPKVPSSDGSQVVNENDRKTNTEEHLQMSEKAIFGFIWKNLGKDFKIRDEQVISRQLTDFLKNVQCSGITSGDDGLIFHFSSLQDFNAVLTKYCPELVGDRQNFEMLTRKFTLIPSRGLYGVFSTKRVDPEDFKRIADCKLYYNSLWFTDKMDVVKALRDENISNRYPTLYIDCRNIMILQSIRPQVPIKLSPVNINLICGRNFQPKQPMLSGFGGNVSYSQQDGKVRRSVPLGPRCQSELSSLSGTFKYDLRLGTRQKTASILHPDQDQYRNKSIEVAANDIKNILFGKDIELTTSLKDIKMRRVELYLKEKLGLENSSDAVKDEVLDVAEGRFEEVRDDPEDAPRNTSAEAGLKEVPVEEAQKVVPVESIKKKVPEANLNEGDNHSLFIPYDSKKNVNLAAELKEDVSWFESPISILPAIQTNTGLSILRIKMSSKEVATAAYRGLNQKYPGLEMDSTGTLVDIVPDKVTGLYTLLFKDKKKKRYLATVARFGPFCSGSQTTPVLAKGQEDDIIYVGFKEKDDALRALQAVWDDEDFPELRVAPGSRG